MACSAERLERHLRMLSACNRRLVRAGSEDELLEGVCRAMVDIGGYRMAWVGVARGDERKNVDVVAQAGVEVGYLEGVEIRWDDSRFGRGPTGTAIRTGEPVACTDIRHDPKFEPWRQDAIAQGYASSAALPIVVDGCVEGALNVYAKEADAFDKDELVLLRELADDLGYGIAHMRSEIARAFLTENLQDALRQRDKLVSELTEARGQLAEVFERVSDGVLGFDEQWRVIYANQLGARALLHDSPERIVGKVVWDIDPRIKNSRFHDACLSAMSRQHPVVLQQRHGMEKRWFELRIYPSLDGLTVFFSDLTEQRRLEAELRALNLDLEERVAARTADLQKANTDLELFSYAISHDLRAPLRAMTGFSEILVRRYSDSLDDRGRHYLNNIIEAGSHMGDLITDLLAYSRLGQGTMELQRVSLGPLLDKVCERVGALHDDEPSTMIISQDMPEVMGVPSLLNEVFSNLLDNALKYHRPGVPAEVHIEPSIDKKLMVIRIVDNGLGIAPEHHEKVFDLFQRLHSPEDYPGTGIGLAVVHKAVALMGGSVVLEANVGEGSCFEVRLPGIGKESNSDDE